MNKPTLIALATAGSLPLALLAASLGSPVTPAAAQAPTATAVAPELLTSPTAAEVVDAADAFLATLSDEQRAIAQVELKPSLAVRWSNLPGGSERRNGVFYRDLKPEQVEAAMKVARVALGEQGFARHQEVRESDEVLDRGRGGRGPGGGGSMFGSANYMIAFLGKPSKTTPWILQLGGHHLAFNLFYKGTAGASTPYHVALQPTVWQDDQGKKHDPLAPMRDNLKRMLDSLTPEQLKAAKFEHRFDDVYLGPQKDGKFPTQSDGVPVSGLSDATKEFIRKAITAWTGDSPQGLEYQKLYFAELDKVKVGYSGTTNVGNERGDYVRLDGPRLWIEFSTQGNDHYHTIWRDRLTDYGAEFSF